MTCSLVKSRGLDRDSFSGRWRGHRRNAARPFFARTLATRPRPGTGDRERAGIAPKVLPSDDLAREALILVARIGLALLLTAGFAAALILFTGLTLASPNLVRACEGFFLWTLAVMTCTTSRRSPRPTGPDPSPLDHG